MTEDGGAAARRSPKPRFPIGLTLAAVVVVAVCCGLGVWQLQRAQWKTHELAWIEARKRAPPTPIDAVLDRAAHGEDVTFTRVIADCFPTSPSRSYPRVTTDNSEWVTRASSFCRLQNAPYDAVRVDRGIVTSSRGSTAPANVALPSPVHVIGVLYRTLDICMRRQDCEVARPAPYTLVAERETPAPPGVTPSPWPDPTDNLQYVGAYWLTWFGLAAAVVGVYAAMLWRRYHPKP